VARRFRASNLLNTVPTQQATPQIDGTWTDGALTTNPAANTVLADTGVLGVGEYIFAFWLGATNVYRMRVELRNAANSSNNNAYTFSLLGGVMIEPVIPIKIALAEGERVRVVGLDTLIGDAQASIFHASLVG